MAYFSGSQGNLYMQVSNTWRKVAQCVDWSLNASQAVLDTTTLEDTDRTIIPGIRSTNGSCTIFYYQETAGSNANNYCAQIIHKLSKERTTGSVDGIASKPETVKFRLVVDDGTADTNTPGKWVEVDALITSAAITMGVGQVFQASINFEVNGAPTDITMY